MSADPQYPDAIHFDQVEVGMALGPVTHHVTAQMVRAYAEATGDTSPDALGPEPVAPPGMATIFSTRLMGRVGIDRPSGGIHAKHEYAYEAPLRAGQMVTTTGRIVEKEVRRGRKYVAYDTVTRGADGQVIVRCRVTQIFAQ